MIILTERPFGPANPTPGPRANYCSPKPPIFHNPRKKLTWLWVKNGYPFWNPSKWNQELRPAVPWWFYLDTYPHPDKFKNPIIRLLVHGHRLLQVLDLVAQRLPALRMLKNHRVPQPAHAFVWGGRAFQPVKIYIYIYIYMYIYELCVALVA